MLLLRKITITHFKNYEQSTFEFDKPVVGICGLNGIGKTNLLDAIYYCCFTKSYFTPTDTLNIGFNKPGFRLEADFENNQKKQHILCIHRGQYKKDFFLNEVPYEKLSRHIGLLPAVMIAPDDIEIIIGNSAVRRKFMDTILCQLNADYMQYLIEYNKILQQRNSLLKREAESGKTDDLLLDILDQQLIVPANFIFDKRIEFTQWILPVVLEMYEQIADKNELIQILFKSSLSEESFGSLLLNNRKKDRILQRTQTGIHKDDLEFELNAQSFKDIASQGQKKSLLFALKLAEYKLIKEKKGFAPLLLLDDVFEKLDESRMRNLLQWVCKKNNGQVFITDTHKDRLSNSFEWLEIEGQILEL